MKYVKVNLSLGDKIKLLFFGLISEDKLPEKEVIKTVQVDRFVGQSTVSTPSKDINNNTEEEETFHVPFFELQDDDVKSNF